MSLHFWLEAAEILSEYIISSKLNCPESDVNKKYNDCSRKESLYFLRLYIVSFLQIKYWIEINNETQVLSNGFLSTEQE